MTANRSESDPYGDEAMRTADPIPSSRSARAQRVLAWFIIAAAGATLCLGWLLPDIGDDGRAVCAINWLSFAIRTFTPHGGVILLLLMLPVAMARAWRPACVLAVLAAACIVPLLGIGSRPTRKSNADAIGITVMSVNVMYGRVRDADLLAEIDRHSPDVVFIQEYTSPLHSRLRHALIARLPHFSIAPRDDAFGMAVFSRLPFAETPSHFPALPDGARSIQPTEPQIRAVVQVGDREVVVQGVHTLPPMNPKYLAEQRKLCRRLADYARTERRPLVLAGDFNHTPSSMPARWLRDAGLTDAHSAAGTGRGLTWPASGGVWSLAGLRLDQILVTDGLRCGWCRVGSDIESDHRPVIARIEFR